MTRELRRLTLEQIRAFVMVAECHSFTNAARSQMRTQTALTRQIRSMEEVLGERLLRRSRGHVEGLTEAGGRLLPYARKVLATVDDAWASLDRPAVTGSIRVGIMDDIDVGWLIDLIARFKAMHPECDVSAVSDFSACLERRLERREVDVAIIKRLATGEGARPKGLLRRERLVWAAGPGFRWKRGEPLPLVVFHEGCVYRRHLIEQLESTGVPARIVYDGQSYANVRSAVFAGLGVTALAESQIEAGGLRHLHAIDGVALHDLGLVDILLCRSQGRESAALAAFAREIERHMTADPGHARRLDRDAKSLVPV